MATPWEEGALFLLSLLPGVFNQGIPFVPAVIDPFEPTGVSFFAGGGGRARPRSREFVQGGLGSLDANGHPLIHEHVHRRRRRRALTNSDRADIAFIAATVSKAAAGTFAAQLAARTR